jgi:hypothetical protein
VTYAVTLANCPRVPPPSRNYSQRLQRPEQRTRKKDGPRKRAAPSPSKRRAQKRPHTATGTRDRATLVRDSSEDDEDEDERCADKAAATSTGPTAFLTSDFEGLKTFLRMRLEELTMKPLRPIVTEWVKLLVPRRQALYGPYHKRHPDTDAPADPAPHWWPTGIQYIEPSHLPKTGVLDLAVDLILQHRDSDIDQVKRRSGWTSIMRREAEYQVTKTAKEMFSSSKDPGFSESMKARALNHVLPEMFDVVQSYEDYVAQNSVALLNGPNATLPKGKKHTYLPVPRPKQPLPRKRVRIEQAVPATIKDEPRDESGSETEVDERMERVTRHYLRRQERAQAQATTPETPAAAAHKVETRSPTETPIAYTTPAAFNLDDHTATASCTSSFNQSMNELQLSDAKGGGGFAEVDYGYTSEMYHQPMQDASMFSNACQSQFHPNPAQVLGTGPFPLYNSYPLHSGTSSFGSSLAVAPGFTYERNGVFSPAPSGAAVLPTTNSFNGLPYDFDVNHQGPSLYYNGTQFAGQPCGDQ